MIEDLIDHLRRHSKLEDSIDVERFDATLSQIAGRNDPSAIGLLAPFFDDNCKFPEAMFSIIHTIERFDDTIYAERILQALPKLWAGAPYWTKVLHFRIFNQPTTRTAYSEALRKGDSRSKHAATEVLITMRDQEPRFRQTCEEMLRLI